MLLTLILLDWILDSDFLFITALCPEVIFIYGVWMFSVLYCWPPRLPREPMICGYRFDIEARGWL